jgi:putative membrane protein
MKKATMHLLLSSGLVVMMASCGNNTGTGTGSDSTNTDPKKEAAAHNDSTFDTSNMKKDASFAVDIADAGMLEVELGKLAQTNASAASVKTFAKEMVTDHGKANDELMTLAKTKGIVLPAALSDKCQKQYNDLSAKKGADFDKAYIDAQVSGHKDVVDLLQKEAEKGEDPDVKTWAQGKLPVVQHHLDMAKQVKDGLKK